MALDIRVWPMLAAFVFLLSTARAFYIPGYSIRSYRDNERIPVLVNKIFSDHSPFQYAYFDLPFVCPPSGKTHASSPFASGHSISLNLGEVLRGDRIRNSDFEVIMGKDVACQFLCQRKVDRKDVKRAKNLISDGYMVEWIMDNLPGATSFVSVDRSKRYYSSGFKLGYKDFSPASRSPRYFIHNHFTFVIRWRSAPGKAGAHGGKVVVGFEVYPKSIGDVQRSANGCPKEVHVKQERLELYIAPNNTRLAEKYPGSSYLPENDDDVDDDGKMTHWLAILNSLTISAVLGFVVLVIWGRTAGEGRGRGEGSLEEGKLKLSSRNSRSGTRTPRTPKTPRIDEKSSSGLLEQGADDDLDRLSDDEIEEVASWKRLHGDVFRVPAYSGFWRSEGIWNATLSWQRPPRFELFRGGFVSVGMGLFVFAGTFSGYFSGRLYKTFGGRNWQKNTLVTALLFPGLIFALVFFLNLFVWAQASSTAIPFSTLVGLVALWLLIQVPLVYAGSWYGYERTTPWEHPTRTNAIPRQIPPQSWYLRTVRGTLLTGLPPFAVLFVELLFVFRNLMQDKSGHYYVFGYLSVVCTVLIITVSQVTIIATYCQLSAENHRWWWQSFITGGSSALWIFLLCIWYYLTRLHIRGFVSSLLFFGYSFLGCTVYGLLTGTVGFLTAYAFVRRIYSSVKAD
ncbi:transmembrane 9 superfamily protein member 4 [Coccidioides immitis RMSCC 3703]|uniref:Transmembrane 9 superfamily member n=1 Tax=Coccidioides immitis RMSCC 3703 TaxID=454286 RepID=A0A0J8QVR8_COCIT|nr:transmembrane 9 superfamily protein member 4 [Coccidioides immitis RMSCC 3703]